MSLCTEEEAKERWCPFARDVYIATDEQTGEAINTHIPSGNRTLRTYPPDEVKTIGQSRCIASQCMAWRWQPLMADQPFMDAVKEHMDLSGDSHPKAVKHVRANLAEYGLPDKPFRGICGLAGLLLK